MATNYNLCVIAGNLSKDPESRNTQSGSAVTNFSVAVNKIWKDKSGEWKTQASFIDVEAWGDLAERISGTFGKGDNVLIEGELVQQRWEQEGAKRSKVIIKANKVYAIKTEGQEAVQNRKSAYEPVEDEEDELNF